LINGISESQVVEIWRHQLLDRTELATESGELIRIIYPGRLNDDQGADFRDAVIAIATRQGTTKGDIEVHVKSSDWQAHHHHRNPVYNRVILHVVLWNDAEVVTSLQDGRSAPILALHKYIDIPVRQWTGKDYSSAALGVPCFKVAERLTADGITKYLDSAGEERFLVKAAGFQADLAQMGAGQSLYQGVMGALGYSKNKMPMLELARRLPLQTLESIARSKMSDAERLAHQQALLFGTAGLLPSQCRDGHQESEGDKWVNRLEGLWASSRLTRRMFRDDWHLFKVRPNNSPVRRIAAMSYLILHYKERAISRSRRRLEKRLLVTANDYWAGYFDFGLGGQIRSLTLLGSSRAADIVVNVLLPFTLAWCQLTSQPELARKVLDLYRHYPELAVNTIERQVRGQLGLNSGLVNSARRQQGLIHIYNTLCTQGKCDSCPLGEAA